MKVTGKERNQQRRNKSGKNTEVLLHYRENGRILEGTGTRNGLKREEKEAKECL